MDKHENMSLAELRAEKGSLEQKNASARQRVIRSCR